MRISDWSSDVCSSDLSAKAGLATEPRHLIFVLISHEAIGLTGDRERKSIAGGAQMACGRPDLFHQVAEAISIARVLVSCKIRRPPRDPFGHRFLLHLPARIRRFRQPGKRRPRPRLPAAKPPPSNAQTIDNN